MTPETVYTLWWISIAVLLIVTGVVAWLLTQVLRTAQNIQRVAGDIWTTGQMVANNTIHIPLRIETNRYAGRLLERQRKSWSERARSNNTRRAAPVAPIACSKRAEA